jgi:hypothetical protein
MFPSLRHSDNRKLRAAVAILATVAGLSALGGSAQAAVIDNFGFYMNNDAEVTFNDGNVAWDWSHATLTAQVSGDLQVVDSYDIANKKLGPSVYDTSDPHGHHLRTNNEKHFAVDMTATPGSSIAYVQVALEKESEDTWRTKQYYNVVPLTHHDDVQILAAGVDVGGSIFDNANHEPSGSATVSWKIGSDGKLKATYHGWLHLEPIFFQGTVRVEIRALNDAGKVLATADGPAYSQKTPAYEADENTLSVETADATRLKVKMQTLGTDPYTGDPVWRDAGEQTVSVAE